ncbi:MAG TPA: signal peptidase II [Candidatus Binatia bacterium]|nr:signal peptidase II [Candidatus Binatia bacterium]
MLLLLTYAAGVLIADQASKRVVQKRLTAPFSWGPLRFMEVRHRERLYQPAICRGAMLLIWCLALFSAAWLHGSGLWLQSPLAVLGVGCALGGAAGNLADVLRQQHIIDFIDLGWWPVFNLADVAIVGGLALALLG